MKINFLVKAIQTCLITGVGIIIATPAHAVNYFFPTAGGGTLAAPPLSMLNGDTFTVNSGIFSNTDDAFNYTVALAATSTVTVDPGATINYAATLGTGATLFYNTAATSITITNFGTISQGNSGAAISIENSGANGTTVLINNSGSIDGQISITGQNNVTINSNGNASYGGPISLTETVGTLNIGPTTATIYNNTSSLSNIALLDIFGGSTLYVPTATNAINTVNIRNNATIYVNNTLQGILVGDGAISNAGLMYLNANITKTGTFTNTGTVVVGTNANVSTSSYISTAGIHRAVMTDLNNLGSITLTNSGDTRFGAFEATYANGYFPTGTYTLVNSSGGIAAGPTSITQPANTLFLQFGTPTVVGNTIQIDMTRTTFQNFAVNNTNKEIATALEIMGASSPSDGIGFVSPSISMVSILNAVELSRTPDQTNNALSQLAPLVSGTTYIMQVQDQRLDPVELRLEQANVGKNYSSGDIFCDNILWLRPFGDLANQQATGASQGYYASTVGVAVGYDRYIFKNFLLGFAASYAAARAKDKINDFSSTSIKSVQLMLYGTYDISAYSYFNWIVSASNNFYKSSRYIAINNSFFGVSAASYYNQWYGIKGAFGKNYSYGKYLLLTPEASIYSGISSLYKYDENGSTAANLDVMAPSAVLVQSAIGGKASAPLELKKYIIVPEIHASALYYIQNGNQTAIANFAEGGTQISANIILPRWGYKYGVSFTLANKKHMQLKFNYDHTGNSGYSDNAFFLTIKYVF